MQVSDLNSGVSAIQNVLATLPDAPGVYRMLDVQQNVLYVGKAKNLKKRVVAYTKVDKLPNRLQRMVAHTVSMEIVVTRTEIEALLLESNLIKQYMPHYNILLKDDKSFPSILLTADHPYARVVKHRGAQATKGKYYGPYANALAVDEAILTLQKIFKLRNCSDSYFANRTRPCLQYHIKRCSAPCVQKINTTEYREAVTMAGDFLTGKGDIVQQALSQKMLQLSDEMAFEKAATIRDTLKLLTAIQADQKVNCNDLFNVDVIAIAQASGMTCVQVFFFRYGRNLGTASYFLSRANETSVAESLSAFLMQFYRERKPASEVLISHQFDEVELVREALKEAHVQALHIDVAKSKTKKEVMDLALQNAKDAIARKVLESDNLNKIFDSIQVHFCLPHRPERIEVYDNSHIQGAHACGVMIVATPSGFDKKSYRQFKPKEAQSNDDFGMMAEFLKRRLQHAEDWTYPDLLLIDGGVGQVSSVRGILQELDIAIPVVGIAKGEDRNAGREHFHVEGKEPFQLVPTDPVLHFLQRIRDEAHRFAIGTHRAKRTKALTTSRLDEVPGIGASRKKKLLLHFGSAQNVKQATVVELMRVDGISQAVAQKIFNYFRNQ